MRLKKIKLSGFKSFVDSTSIHIPSSLIGIVGPNGCGKSNTIDAVRWVMGEISAKHLRGDSMADVIFNGSSSRKPVGQASVELVFDNNDGKLTGQYANYSEIALKRQVSRDGQSNYYLNGTKCRRRDITDIFLGTGLGPRSYAIIEQGMISRVIEAKPEELRSFLEEAAGISKYKERRRETENRIRHTRDNLDRLNDLREEVEKRLGVLQRQAKTAEKYKELKEEERKLIAEHRALRWKKLNEDAEDKERYVKESETKVEATIAEQRHVEAEIEKAREEHTTANDAFNEVQGNYYKLGGEIARTEQSIQHTRDTRQRQEQDLSALEDELQGVVVQISSDEEQHASLQAQIEEISPQLEEARSKETASQASLQQAENNMQSWQTSWDEFTVHAAKIEQTVEVERRNIQHIENQVAQHIQRQSRLEGELQGLEDQSLDREISTIEEELALVSSKLDEKQQLLDGSAQKVTSLRDQQHELSNDLHQQREQLQDAKGRLASLEALQQAALGKSDDKVTSWLESHSLANAPRLAQKIESVEDGWEKAVETVLGSYLQAVCVDALDPLADWLDEIEAGTLLTYETSGNTSAGASSDQQLLSKVTCPHDLSSLLGNILVADNLAQALERRKNLSAQQSIITRDGIWLGPNWLRVAKDTNDEQSGVIAREQEIKSLTATIEQQQAQVEEKQAKQQSLREELVALEQQREEMQREINQLHHNQAQVQAQLSRKQSHLEQNQARAEKVQVEIQEVKEQILQGEAEVRQSRESLDSAISEMEKITAQRQDFLQQKESLQTELNRAKEQARVDYDAAHELVLKVESARTQLTSLQQSMQRLQQQREAQNQRAQSLRSAIEQSTQPLQEMQQTLEGQLKSRADVEQSLTKARQELEAIDHSLREREQARVAAEEKVQSARELLQQKGMQLQEVQVRRQTVREQVDETGFALDELFAGLPEDATVDAWGEQVEQMARRIQRLGAINLAAIDEFKEESERKEYLDAQNMDLTEALETLENAIRKIDRETRTRFKETFDKVNAGIQKNFPRLFGGGHAYLELTGEDLLDSGVGVFARPPGKRLSSIHLMSGGEKALTAVALVFSIFELNPAPFCMLDEVDAPLDDANVGRFCDLVKEMSERVQFIFITHNKITMELADYLMGVTMHEPGVSRLVAVDVDEAAQMAAS